MLTEHKYIAICLLISIAIFVSPGKSYAHSIFYEGSPPIGISIPLVWDERVAGKAHLKMNGDYLSNDYSSHYVTASDAWPDKSSKVSVTRTISVIQKLTLLRFHNYIGIIDGVHTHKMY